MTGNELIVDYLTSVPPWYLATVEDTPEAAQPHVRPFSFAGGQGGGIGFCTATPKDVYRELEANPKFELTAWKPGSGWVIMRGKAVLKDEANEDVRRAGYEHMTGLGESYEGPGDETLTFFTVSEPEAWLCDIGGSWNNGNTRLAGLAISGGSLSPAFSAGQKEYKLAHSGAKATATVPHSAANQN